MGHGGNVIEELMVDHREVEQMFDRFNALPAGDSGRKAIADTFTIELVPGPESTHTHEQPDVPARRIPLATTNPRP